jgi:dTDP-4-dehydrorhamnose 3,5-epimerase
MKVTQSKLQGCYFLQSDIYKDCRGLFNKTYNHDIFKQENINLNIKEQFYTVSDKDVLRGMHFQLPPYQHNKLVNCLSGSILDVVVDLRKSSSTYAEFDFFELKGNDGSAVYIPSGMAHGFLSLEDNSGVLYNTSKVYNMAADKGVHWNSFGFDWKCKSPIISERDMIHLPLNQLKKVFK